MLFISHSSLDKELVQRLVDVFCTAMALPAQCIICSSVDGCTLGTGERIDVSVERAVRESRAFLAILSPNSAASNWVLFELGARWGYEPVRFLRVPGHPEDSLPRPYDIRLAADATNRGRIHQLVRELNEDLGLPYPVQPDAYATKLEEFLAAARQYEAIEEATRKRGIVSRRAFSQSPKLPGEVFAIEFLEREVEIEYKPTVVEIRIDRRDVREMAISNPAKTAKVKELITDANEQRVIDCDHEIQAHLGDTTLTKHVDRIGPRDLGIKLRWASGGVLSIVKRRGQLWVPFFFRDIRPYGWNISLGQTERLFRDGRELQEIHDLELTDPRRYIVREFVEESLILSHDPNERKQLELKRFSLADDVTVGRDHDEEHRNHRRDRDHLRILESGQERIVTDDAKTRFRVRVESEKGLSVTTHNVLVCFSLLDLGIEVVKIYEYDMPAPETMLDGEIQEKTDPESGKTHRELVRMPIALMSLGYLRRTFGDRQDWQSYTAGPQPSIEIPADAVPAQDEIELFTWDVKRRMEIVRNREGAPFMQERFLGWYDTFRDNFFDEDENVSCAKPSRLFVPGTAKILNLYFKTVRTK